MEETDQTAVAEPEDDIRPEDLAAAIEASLKDFNDGDLVSGKIVRIDRDEVLLDVGYKSEGVIPIRELSLRQDADPSDEVKIGQEIEALVLQKEDKEGRLILSKKRASYERAWGSIEHTMSEGGTITGRVIEVVKGGLIVDIGLRGFLPASLVELRRVRDLHPYVGQELECKIIELDRNRNNVVLSRRAFLEESQSEGRRKFLESLKPGERRTGTVSSIVNFGAFIDLGGVDGLVHVSELSWRHVDNPSEVVAVGEEVEVEVLDVDLERERVSLSLKATQEDPWKEFERRFQAGEVVEGEVTKLVPFGAFVRVSEGIEGLVHISELSDEHVESADQIVQAGDRVRVKVVEVDVARRRVSLSMKRVDEAPEAEIEAEPAEASGEAAGQESAEIGEESTELPRSEGEAPEVEVEGTAEAPPEEAPAPDEVDAPELEPEPVREAEEDEEAREAEGDVSLESIVEDLKRREGRQS
ncbi:MAG: 30S ribosomal protein S1 [Actinomycetota bacterium]